MITYLFNFVLCSGLMLAAYRAFLGTENLYRFNRFYLLFSLVFSLLVPAITIHVPYVKMLDNSRLFAGKAVDAQQPVIKLGTASITADQAPFQMDNQLVNIPDNAANEQLANTVSNVQSIAIPHVVKITPVRESVHFNLMAILLALYGAVVLLLLWRFVRNSYRINRLIEDSELVIYQDVKLVLVKDDVTPHSFLKYVFLNKEAYYHKAIEPEIICHEQAHVRQRHSLDVIWIELLQIVCWFNPLIPLYRKAIQLNHEFLADEAVIENYQNTPAYQYLLLAKASQSGSLYLTSQFNYLVTKKRIIMMTKNTTAAIALYKRLILLPILAIALFLFSQKIMAQNAKKTDAKHKSSAIEASQQDASQNVLDEYSKILAKYGIPYRKGEKINYKPDFSAADKERLTVLYKQMSNNQQQQQYVRLVPMLDQVMFPVNHTNLIDWQNKTKYEIWIDGKPSNNVDLSTFKSTDFYGAILYGRVGKKDSRIKMNLLTHAYYKQNRAERMKGHFIYIPKEKWKYVNWPIGGVVNKNLHVQAIQNASIQSAVQDAPQSIIEQYAAILKKYNFPPDTAKLKEILTPPYPKHKLLGTPNFSKEDKVQLLSLFKQMSSRQQQEQWVIFIKSSRPLPKTAITEAQLNDWKNPKEYGVWIDDKRVNNAALVNYKATNFDLFLISKLYGEALQGRSYHYQVNLMTKPYYVKYVNETKARDPYLAFGHVPGINKVSFVPPVQKGAELNTQHSPLIVIDGQVTDKKIPNGFNSADKTQCANFLSLAPSDIKSISIIKGEEAVATWGKWGANGVLVIYTSKTPSQQINFFNGKVESGHEPLVIVDGKASDKKMPVGFDFGTAGNQQYADLLSMNSKDIKTISVFKENAATAIWGSKAANGVIMITTRGAENKSLNH